MASHIDLAGSGVQVKLRRPVAVAALSIFTLGIYSIFWYYSVGALFVLAGFVAFVLTVSLIHARLNAAWSASEAIAERFQAVPAAS